MAYQAEQLLQPRAFVLAGNAETMVLQSETIESRLTFLNSVSAASQQLLPRYVFSFSNQDLNLLFNDTELTKFRNNPTTSKREVLIKGSALASNVQLLSPIQKGIILQDYNPASSNQFAGIGVTNTNLIFQIPTRTFKHVFQAAVYDGGNVEWMRIQESATGVAQVGIGTTNLATTDALAVKGDTSLQGNLVLTGNLNVAGTFAIQNSSFVQIEPETQRLATSILPQKVPLLNNANKLDESVLPSSYNFQFLRSQQSVGIGTRNPAQKLHVWGSAAISERIGIGTTIPISRLHIFEPAGSINAMTIQSTGGGDAMQIYVGSNIVPSMIAVGTHNAVGIGTGVVNITNKLEVGGNIRVHGNITCGSINYNNAIVSGESLDISTNTDGIIFRTELITDNGTGLQIPRIYGGYRMDLFRGLTTNTISSYTPLQAVHFVNSSIEVDGDTILARQPLIVSDRRHKYDILAIDNALDALDNMRGYTYHLGDGRREAGVIAQEVLEVFPEAVSTTNKDYYMVRYDSIIALLLEGYRALKQKVETLEQRI